MTSINFKHTWPAGTREDALAAMMAMPTRNILLGGLDVWTPFEDNEPYSQTIYVTPVTSKGVPARSAWLYLNQHDLAHFCQRYLDQYTGTWVFRVPDGEGGWLYDRDDTFGQLVPSLDEAQHYELDETLSTAYDEIASLRERFPNGQFVPLAVARRDEALQGDSE